MESGAGGKEKLRRSQLEMMIDVLSAVAEGGEGAKPTHIAYRANLSWAVLSKSLCSMVSSGLIEKVEVGRRTEYRVAAKGCEILTLYESLKVGLGDGSADLGSSRPGVRPVYPNIFSNPLAR